MYTDEEKDLLQIARLQQVRIAGPGAVGGQGVVGCLAYPSSTGTSSTASAVSK